MTRSAQRLLLSTLLVTAAACDDSGDSTGKDGSAGHDGAAGALGHDGAAGASVDGAAGSAGSDAGASDTAPPNDGAALTDGGNVTTTTKMITAATGGVLAITGGTLRIPGGTLAADGAITVKESAPAADTPNKDLIDGLIYDLGPDGTKFKTPVELTLPLSAAVPGGKSAVIAFLDPKTKVWVPLSSTMVGTQKVSGLTTHFTSFAVLLVPTGGQCPAVAPCGGSLVGNWQIATFCQAKPQQVVSVDCKDGTFNTARAVFDISGTFAVAADNSYTFSHSINVSRLTSSSPACIALSNTALPPGMQITTCAGLEPGLTKEFSTPTTCSGSVSDVCTCLATTPTAVQETGTIAVSGMTFTTTKTGMAPGMPNTYCVQGNTLTATTADGTVYTGIKM